MSLDLSMFGSLDLVKAAARKVGEVRPLVDVTDMDFPGLSLEGLDGFQMRVSLINPLGGPCNYYLYANGDFVLANYSLQLMAAAGAAVVGLAQATPVWFLLGPGESSQMCFEIGLSPGGEIDFCEHGQMQDAAFVVMAVARTANPVSDITRLTLRSALVNGIGAGSVAILLEDIK